MKSDNYDKLHYWDYIKDIKFLLDSHVPQLQGWEPKDVVKMIKTMVQDPKCKYLHPSESTEAISSDDGMPQKFDTLSEADIMAEFPQDMLTPEVRTNILNMIEHVEAPHPESAEAMQCMKKLDYTSWCIPFAVASNGATLYHDSALMTSLHQNRQRRKALCSFTGRYGSRWRVVPKSAESYQDSCCNITLSAKK